jgi:MYND finger
MVKSAKRSKKKSSSTVTSTAASNGGGTTTTAATTAAANNNSNNNTNYQYSGSQSTTTTTGTRRGGDRDHNHENLDELHWLRECEVRHTGNGDPYLQLEYQDDDELILLLHRFLDESVATKDIIDNIYQIWQQTVIGTLLQSSTVWKKEVVNAVDQRQMKETLKTARYKINFILHHVTGSILTHNSAKWTALRPAVLDMCHNTLLLVPRLAESCPHSPHDIRMAIIHFEGKEFLAAVACETWDTLYDYAILFDHERFIPVLRRCAMLDILDKDWNMLGGWEDILKGLESKCCPPGTTIPRLPTDTILHETTTILRNARNSMQCKFFSVRFMRYSEDQAPQRWRYFRKCSAPACAHIETREYPHPHRCDKCWYFHYCSPACMEYCDHIMGLHPKFCLDTPTGKAALCRKETEVYLGWTSATSSTSSSSHPHNSGNGSGGAGDPNNTAGMDPADGIDPTSPPLACAACGAVDLTVSSSSSKQLKRCQQCRSVSYCSRQCQEWDWRVGGHRSSCVSPVITMTTTTTTTSSSAAATTTPSRATPPPPLNGSTASNSTATATTTATTTTDGGGGTGVVVGLLPDLN